MTDEEKTRALGVSALAAASIVLEAQFLLGANGWSPDAAERAEETLRFVRSMLDDISFSEVPPDVRKSADQVLADNTRVLDEAIRIVHLVDEPWGLLDKAAVIARTFAVGICAANMRDEATSSRAMTN